MKNGLQKAGQPSLADIKKQKQPNTCIPRLSPKMNAATTKHINYAHAYCLGHICSINIPDIWHDYELNCGMEMLQKVKEMRHGLSRTRLCELEWHFEGERLVVVGVEGALLYGRLLLPQPLPVLHQRYLHVRICRQ